MQPTNNYGHDFDEQEVPVCKKCGLSIVKAHIWGDETWTQNPVECGSNFEEKQPTLVETVVVEAQEATGGIPHEIIPGLTSIIIPIYNIDYSLMHYTGNCLGAVREHTDKTKTPYEIILVDNASPIKLEPSMYPVEKVIVNEVNLGYAKAVNKGIRVSQGEYVCVMNNDTQVFEHWLEDMQEALTKLDLVMATPMYGEPFARAVESAKKRLEFENKPIEDSFSDFRDFSCILTKRSVFETIGTFDEDFFMYGEDLDLIRRMEREGLKVASSKKVNIYHVIGATSTSIAETPEIMNDSKALLKEKYGE